MGDPEAPTKNPAIGGTDSGNLATATVWIFHLGGSILKLTRLVLHLLCKKPHLFRNLMRTWGVNSPSLATIKLIVSFINAPLLAAGSYASIMESSYLH